MASYMLCDNRENESNATCALPYLHVCDSISHCVDDLDESRDICEDKGRNR